MATEWRVSRTNIPKRDGQLRWDTAYQLLLQWGQSDEVDAPSSTVSSEGSKNGNCSVCARLDHEPTNGADNRTTTRPVKESSQ